MVVLSIITIAYNDALGLERTLKSLHPLAPLAVVNDFSWEQVIVDSSPNIHAPVLERHSQLRTHQRIFTQNPQGIYSAFNEGLRQVSGEIIWFLNSGDMLGDVEPLLKAIETLRRSNVDIWYGGADIFRDQVLQYRIFPPASFGRALVGRNWICHQAMLYKKNVFEKVGNFSLDYSNTGDYEHHLRCLTNGMVARSDRLCFCGYDRGGGSDQTDLVFKEFAQIQNIYSQHFSLLGRFLHHFVRSFEYCRIKFIKKISSSRLRFILRLTLAPIKYLMRAL